MALNDFFVWGDGGRRLTPDEIARERMLAAAQKPKTGPVGHWTQGAARVVDALAGSLRESQLKEAAKANAEEDKSAFSDLAALLVAPPQAASAYGDASPAAYGAAGAASAPAAPVGGSPAPDDIKSGIAATAEALGIDPVDLATAISYETGGTFDPTKAGPTTQWGQHRGLIQFGEPQAQKYGVDWNNPVGSQLGPDGAVARYLRDTGVKPGMGLMDIYSAINAGGVGRYDRSDANNGGAPGTVADKVNNQMAGHRQKALALFGGEAAPVRVASSDPNDFGPVAMALAQSQPQRPPNPVATALAQAPQQAASPQINPAIMEALTSPYVSRDVKALAGSMLQHQMQAQQQANDPLRRLQLERAELENEALRNPQPKPTDDVREYEYARSQGFQGSFRDYQVMLREAGRPSTSVNIDQKAQGALEKTLGEQVGKTFGTMYEEGAQAGQDLYQIARLRDLLQQSGSGLAPALTNVAASFGLNLGEGADAGQAAKAIISYLTPRMRVPGTGASSDRDVSLFQQALPSLLNTPQGNQLILQTMQGLAEYKRAQGDIAGQVVMGEMDPREAAKAIRALPDPFAQFKAAQQGQQQPQASGAPAVGFEKDGYRFKGGNPADPGSWEKL